MNINISLDIIQTLTGVDYRKLEKKFIPPS